MTAARSARRAALLPAVVLVAVLGASSPAAAQSNTISTVAGTGTAGFSGDGGSAFSAQLAIPIGLGINPGGGYLIADQANNRVRFVGADGRIDTIAGSGAIGPGGDQGPATAAQMNAPSGVARAHDGGVLIADANNNKIRRVDPDGTITTVVGNGNAAFSGDNGPAAAAEIRFPYDVAVKPDGGYLIADVDNNRIRQVDSGGTITTVAGNGSLGTGGDGGQATSAQLNDPSGVALTADGGFVVADTGSNRVRRVAPDGTITPLAGTGTASYTGDNGPATAATLNAPAGVAVTSDGSVLIADRLNHVIRRVDPGGTIVTVAGTGAGGFNGDGAAGTATQLNTPFDVDVNAEGDYLISDTNNHRIRSLDVAAPPPPAVPVPSALVLDPSAADRTPGDANVISATVHNDDGSVAAGRTVRWSVAGPNAVDGTAVTDGSGVAQITWDGIREGTDTVIAYVDTNANSTREEAEPAASATVSWTLPAPVARRTVNIEPISGIVRIRLPRSSARTLHGAGATGGVQRLEQAQQVPIGTQIDVRKGHVGMTTLANTRGSIQKGEFYDGIYTTAQVRVGSRLTTELRLVESLVCPSSRRREVGPSRARSRRLWGNARGRFRTRGRHSTATVRGTIWLQKDTCTTTTTVVRQGVVTVRDFAKRKNVRVKAGKRYVARTRRR